MSDARALLRRSMPPWWAYDGFLVGLGVAALVASWLLSPGEDPRWVYFPNGHRFGDTCAFLVTTGYPCPQCGMTRAFVHAARGRLLQSFAFSPGGFGLFVWIEVAAVLAAIRLARRDPSAVVLPWRVPVAWALFWMVGLYVAPWILRLQGLNPLP